MKTKIRTANCDNGRRAFSHETRDYQLATKQTDIFSLMVSIV